MRNIWVTDMYSCNFCNVAGEILEKAEKHHGFVTFDGLKKIYSRCIKISPDDFNKFVVCITYEDDSRKDYNLDDYIKEYNNLIGEIK